MVRNEYTYSCIIRKHIHNLGNGLKVFLRGGTPCVMVVADICLNPLWANRNTGMAPVNSELHVRQSYSFFLEPPQQWLLKCQACLVSGAALGH